MIGPFVFHNGRAAHTISELLSIIEESPKKVFEEHVGKDRNDFAAWIDLGMQEPGLAKELRKTIDRLQTIITLREWLKARPLEMHKHHFLVKGSQNEFLLGLMLGLILGIILFQVVRLLA